ncbi:hypothetical protein BJ508DRAFT_24255 [Ascobolus immersus RN42]|uniref:Uncharacterized protein n=1 Tax=Ascobolus immersus RN42 TaxID=1160509 RepID=A0A3N4HMR7_ASCIM|nr:hypothetical protein BJ508DRAFT_24255 [Ascobolus immersus RN42]
MAICYADDVKVIVRTMRDDILDEYHYDSSKDNTQQFLASMKMECFEHWDILRFQCDERAALNTACHAKAVEVAAAKLVIGQQILKDRKLCDLIGTDRAFHENAVKAFRLSQGMSPEDWLKQRELPVDPEKRTRVFFHDGKRPGLLQRNTKSHSSCQLPSPPPNRPPSPTSSPSLHSSSYSSPPSPSRSSPRVPQTLSNAAANDSTPPALSSTLNPTAEAFMPSNKNVPALVRRKEPLALSTSSSPFDPNHMAPKEAAREGHTCSSPSPSLVPVNSATLAAYPYWTPSVHVPANNAALTACLCWPPILVPVIGQQLGA